MLGSLTKQNQGASQSFRAMNVTAAFLGIFPFNACNRVQISKMRATDIFLFFTLNWILFYTNISDAAAQSCLLSWSIFGLKIENANSTIEIFFFMYIWQKVFIRWVFFNLNLLMLLLFRPTVPQCAITLILFSLLLRG